MLTTTTSRRQSEAWARAGVKRGDHKAPVAGRERGNLGGAQQDVFGKEGHHFNRQGVDGVDLVHKSFFIRAKLFQLDAQLAVFIH